MAESPFTNSITDQFNLQGYQVIDAVFPHAQIALLKQIIARYGSQLLPNKAVANTHAIRDFFSQVPESKEIILNNCLANIIAEYGGTDFFIVKSIYFDKPPELNWFVSWHQDLTISVKEKIDHPGFSKWAAKQYYFSDQPPQGILENILTIRIHLDDTDENNGALSLMPGSHLNGIQRFSPDLPFTKTTCPVKMGGIMLMRPLLFHSSSRTKNAERRRVIHIELSNARLPGGLSWAEAESGRGAYNPLGVR